MRRGRENRWSTLSARLVGGHGQEGPGIRGDAGHTEHARLEPRLSWPVVRSSGSVGSHSPVKTPDVPPLALFHTMVDMMTVILRIDAWSSSNPFPRARIVGTSLSDLISINTRLAMTASAIRTVWHTGCLKYGCEGLRVLGTRQMTGWGLGITEIGRTVISSPRNNYWHSFQANPQQPI